MVAVCIDDYGNSAWLKEVRDHVQDRRPHPSFMDDLGSKDHLKASDAKIA